MRTICALRCHSIVWVLVLVILDACRVQPPQAATVSPGATPAQVRTLLGEPTRLQNFLLPEAPFFGPQESLTNLIPAGTPVEEWVYVQGNEELYVWFVCTQGSSEGECTVIESARYPVGAVY